ncbi:hypothetical protein [Aliiroseovarius crassostreae]|uniref:hypothetical protein n=1 Tax=Aliiroseovarius crassostreae TaxID=154981 RepID=UPI003C7A264F
MKLGSKVVTLLGAGVLSLGGHATQAQQFTTAAEIRPILEATQANWIAVREYDGQDLLYFTHLLAWRCGLEQVRYAVNGGEMQAFELEPCYMEEAQPNAIKSTEILPFVTLDLKAVNTVDVELFYDDGTTATGSYERGSIQIN